MNTTKRLFSVGLAPLVATAGLSMSSGRAHADDPVWHQVTYTISAKNPISAEIFYQDQDPTVFSDYSYNN